MITWGQIAVCNRLSIVTESVGHQQKQRLTRHVKPHVWQWIYLKKKDLKVNWNAEGQVWIRHFTGNPTVSTCTNAFK